MRLRSLLFVPGDRPDRFSKAQQGAADALIIDFEDSVAPSRKAEARIQAAEFLSVRPRSKPLFVRINAIDSPYFLDDLAAIAQGDADGLVLPKSEGSKPIVRVRETLHEMHADCPQILPIAIETPLSIFKVCEFLPISDFLIGITWGAEDLQAAIGSTVNRLGDGSLTPPYELVRSMSLFAARAAGVRAFDTVYPNYKDVTGMADFARRSARDGFAGMLAIHPQQVTIINEAFTPDQSAIARAQRICEHFAKNADVGVIAIDGEMVDAPHYKLAKQLLDGL